MSKRSSRIWFGAGVVGLLTLAAIFAPLLAPHDPLEQDLLNTFAAPFWHAKHAASFALGTDSLGRDIASRLIYGARIALTVALVAATLAALLGSVLGLLAGFFGGWIDTLISRLVDVWMSFPPVLLSIVLGAVLGPGMATVIVAIVVIDWTRFCRVVRSEVLLQRELDYVSAAQTIGLRPAQILGREIVPNVAPLLLTLLTLEMGIAVVVETVLSFVGLGIASGAASWGSMIADGRFYINQAWWLLALPVACVIVVVLGFNAFGDGLRDRLDPLRRAGVR
jgi:peptide/nickel transport system permease protein